MAQTTSGIHSILSNSAMYSIFQKLIGSKHGIEVFITEYLRPHAGCRILDLGCGPANILAFLPNDTQYYGCDLSEEYLAKARQRFGDRGTFWQADFSGESAPPSAAPGSFDIVMILGVLHHLDDVAAETLLREARRMLRLGGRLACLEAVFTPKQNIFARIILNLDRGRNIRNANGYMTLVKKYFQNANYTVRTDLLRLPYSHIIIEATAE